MDGRRTAIWSLLVAVLLAGCNGDVQRGGRDTDDPGAAGKPGSMGEAPGSSKGGGFKEWIAVFETAGDPEDLQDRQTHILRRAPRNVLVGPAGCHEGLADELSVSEETYVAGVVARTMGELRAAIRRVDLETVFEGRLQLLCGA
jgi:hypothetical protein